MSDALKSIRDLEVSTPEGRAAKRAAEEYLAKIRTPEGAFEVLKRIGIYNEDGTPNPYFYPDAEADETVNGKKRG